MTGSLGTSTFKLSTSEYDYGEKSGSDVGTYKTERPCSLTLNHLRRPFALFLGEGRELLWTEGTESDASQVLH